MILEWYKSIVNKNSHLVSCPRALTATQYLCQSPAVITRPKYILSHVDRMELEKNIEVDLFGGKKKLNLLQAFPVFLSG